MIQPEVITRTIEEGIVVDDPDFHVRVGQLLTASDFRTDLAAASWERGDPVVNLVFECQA